MAERTLGKVLDVTVKGTLLVPMANPDPNVAPRLGTRVVDARNAAVGRVVDVIGPVSAPTLVVAPRERAKVHRLLGKDVYAR